MRLVEPTQAQLARYQLTPSTAAVGSRLRRLEGLVQLRPFLIASLFRPRVMSRRAGKAGK